jgi:hypothetical protein
MTKFLRVKAETIEDGFQEAVIPVSSISFFAPSAREECVVVELLNGNSLVIDLPLETLCGLLEVTDARS